ncbi:hypothetical protein ACFBZI_08735 [Moraxella sp. ZJ142]|uniref:hypothetical protein n=1 Tax=Moraxella marmotae TaxID=3344520 RepID=UPI0035D44A54
MADGKGYLYVGKDSEPLYLAYYLTTYFEKVIVPLSEIIGGDFRDEKEYGQLMVGFLSIKHLNAEHFNYAYHLTMQACQDDENLAKYKDELDKLFKSDPRFAN